jgi:hypothetical protein
MNKKMLLAVAAAALFAAATLSACSADYGSGSPSGIFVHTTAAAAAASTNTSSSSSSNGGCDLSTTGIEFCIASMSKSDCSSLASKASMTDTYKPNGCETSTATSTCTGTSYGTVYLYSSDMSCTDVN